jgi:hypothetical protein
MKRLRYLVCLVVLLLVAGGMKAQDILVPAGTLLQCTMDEPNFSSATASVGDPVLCHFHGEACWPDIWKRIRNLDTLWEKAI